MFPLWSVHQLKCSQSGVGINNSQAVNTKLPPLFCSKTRWRILKVVEAQKSGMGWRVESSLPTVRPEKVATVRRGCLTVLIAAHWNVWYARIYHQPFVIWPELSPSPLIQVRTEAVRFQSAVLKSKWTVDYCRDGSNCTIKETVFRSCSLHFQKASCRNAIWNRYSIPVVKTLHLHIQTILFQMSGHNVAYLVTFWQHKYLVITEGFVGRMSWTLF